METHVLEQLLHAVGFIGLYPVLAYSVMRIIYYVLGSNGVKGDRFVTALGGLLFQMGFVAHHMERTVTLPSGDLDWALLNLGVGLMLAPKLIGILRGDRREPQKHPA